MTDSSTTCKGALDIPSSALPPGGEARTDGRDTAGRFVAGNAIGEGSRFEKGNEVALVHGAHRELDYPLDETKRVAIRAEVLEDLGGEGECSAVLRELIEDFASAVVLRDLSFSYIASHGPLTQKGRRRAVVQLWLEASGRVERLAARIGTGRRAKRVPSIAEHLAGKGVKNSAHLNEGAT